MKEMTNNTLQKIMNAITWYMIYSQLIPVSVRKGDPNGSYADNG